MKKTIFASLVIGIVILSGCSHDPNSSEADKLNLDTSENIKDSSNKDEFIKKIYYNKEMGISFSYNPKEYVIKESRDLIEIGFIDDPMNATRIELFKKESSKNMPETIMSTFLKNDINKNCIIKKHDSDIDKDNKAMEQYGIHPKLEEGYYDYNKGCGVKEEWREGLRIFYNPSFSREKFIVMDISQDQYEILEHIKME